MRTMLLLASLVLAVTAFCGQAAAHVEEESNRSPIVGILFQEAEESDDKVKRQELSGSYVGFLHAAGVRTAPILLGKDEDYYKNMFKWTNGVIFPGGYNLAVDPVHSNYSETLYFNVAKKFFEMAKKAKDNGDYYPIFGSCMGCETLIMLTTDTMDARKTHIDCDAWYHQTNLNFVMDNENLKQTRLFSKANNGLLKNLQDENISNHAHRLCLTQDNYDRTSKLNEFMKIIAKNSDKNGTEFITLMEGKEYPFTCSMIHPEDTIIATNDNEECKLIPRTKNAIEAAQYFARFIANEARKSKHKFEDEEKEKEALIYSYEKYRKLTPKAEDCAPEAYFPEIKQ